MSNLSFQIGYSLGTAAREFMRAIRRPTTQEVKAPSANAHASFPGPCLSPKVVDDLSHIPAMVRAKGVDLNHWYDVNTRVAAQPARKRRSRAKKTVELVAASPRLGSLNDLICPVDARAIC
ncbi:hypothetical protein [Pseudomonas chlororaphis]|uniref:hypothetical protein n=1 Tax=Pseudomonas chlororaphis TaxID=587753 RepID=UPI0011850223|nr:hypothetical protein [Pseudomonas chlororaphis]